MAGPENRWCWCVYPDAARPCRWEPGDLMEGSSGSGPAGRCRGSTVVQVLLESATGRLLAACRACLRVLPELRVEVMGLGFLHQVVWTVCLAVLDFVGLV